MPDGGFPDATPDGGPCPTWIADVWPLLDAPTGANCTGTGTGLSSCHGDGKGGVLLQAGKPTEALVELMGTTLAPPAPAKKYIVPGDPAASGFVCNLSVTADGGAAVNPYGECGSLMPLTAPMNLTVDQLNTIADWIACGAN